MFDPVCIKKDDFVEFNEWLKKIENLHKILFL
jgi:hypothetical protein